MSATLDCETQFRKILWKSIIMYECSKLTPEYLVTTNTIIHTYKLPRYT